MTERVDQEFKVEGAAPSIKQTTKHAVLQNNGFIIFVYLIQIAIIILYATCTKWGQSTELVGARHSWYVESAQYNDDDLTEEQKTGISQSIRLYPSFQDIHVMIFIGFGFLMTYLRAHSWTSVGLNLLASAFAIQVYILSKGFWKRALDHASWSDQIDVNFSDFIFADFAAGAVMITYGGLLGQINAFQLLFTTLIEVFIYALNEVVVFENFRALDTGGSMTIHTFGAVFGVVLGCIMRPKDEKGQYIKANHNAEGGFVSNVFSFLGTMFLWMFWPSFNSAPSALPNGQERAIVCTVLSLTGSCITAYLISFCKRAQFTKFGIEDLLNATLAGGVMIGTSADLLFDPYAAIIVGCFAGVVSAYGFAVVGAKLTGIFGMYDTCGITYLHCIPGILGGVISAIVLGSYTKDNLMGDPVAFLKQFTTVSRTPQEQAQIQIASTVVSIAFAIAAALVTGIFLQALDSTLFKGINTDDMFMDSFFFKDAHEQDDVVIEKIVYQKKDMALGDNDRLPLYNGGAEGAANIQRDNQLFTDTEAPNQNLNEAMKMNLERLGQIVGNKPLTPFEISKNH